MSSPILGKISESNTIILMYLYSTSVFVLTTQPSQTDQQSTENNSNLQNVNLIFSPVTNLQVLPQNIVIFNIKSIQSSQSGQNLFNLYTNQEWLSMDSNGLAVLSPQSTTLQITQNVASWPGSIMSGATAQISVMNSTTNTNNILQFTVEGLPGTVNEVYPFPVGWFSGCNQENSQANLYASGTVSTIFCNSNPNAEGCNRIPKNGWTELIQCIQGTEYYYCPEGQTCGQNISLPNNTQTSCYGPCNDGFCLFSNSFNCITKQEIEQVWVNFSLFILLLFVVFIIILILISLIFIKL